MTAFNAQRARAKRPCPLWVDAFQRDTQHLGADEVGAYMLILMAMWTRESCDFPADDARLANVSRVSLRLWKSRIGPALMGFFTVQNGQIISKRLRIEAEFTEKMCQQQSDRKSGYDKKSRAYAKPQGNNEPSQENAEKSAKPLESNEPTKSTDTSAAGPRYYPTQLPNYPTLKEEEEGASASENQPDLVLRLLHSLGFDRGQTIPKYWASPDAHVIVSRWQTSLGLTPDEIEFVARQNSIQHGQPANGPKTLTPHMERFAGAKSQPMQPATHQQSQTLPTDDQVSRVFAQLRAEKGIAQ